MVEFIVEEPKEGDSDKRAYKYPFICSEAFKSEPRQLIDFFFKQFDPEQEKANDIPTISKLPEKVLNVTESRELGTATEDPSPTSIIKSVIENIINSVVLALNSEQTAKQQKMSEIIKLEEKSNQNEEIKYPILIKADSPKNNESLKFSLKMENCESDIVLPTQEGPIKYPMLEKLLSILDPKSELNTVLAGYFGKTLNAIFNLRKYDLMNYIMKIHKNHMENLIFHCYNQSVSDILLKLLKFEDEPSNDAFIPEKTAFIELILENAISAKNPEQIPNNLWVLGLLAHITHASAIFIGDAMISKIFKFSVNGGDRAMKACLDYLNTVIKIKTEPANQLSLLNGSPISSQLQQRFNFLSSPEAPEEGKKREIDMSNIIKNAIIYLPQYKAILEDIKIIKELELQSGDKAPCCGIIKLVIVEFLQNLLKLKDLEINKKIEELNLIPVLLNLVKVYYMNTNLHLKIFNILKDGIQSGIDQIIETVFLYFKYEKIVCNKIKFS